MCGRRDRSQVEIQQTDGAGNGLETPEEVNDDDRSL